MSASDILGWITGAAGALVVLAIGLWMFITGRIVPRSALEYRNAQIREKDAVIAAKDATIATERARADAAILATQISGNFFAALHQEVSDGEVARKAKHPRAAHD